MGRHVFRLRFRLLLLLLFRDDARATSSNGRGWHVPLRPLRPRGANATRNTTPAGADVQSGHPGLGRHGDPKLAGMIEVRVSCGSSTRPKVEAVLREMGGQVG